MHHIYTPSPPGPKVSRHTCTSLVSNKRWLGMHAPLFNPFSLSLILSSTSFGTLTLLHWSQLDLLTYVARGDNPTGKTYSDNLASNSQSHGNIKNLFLRDQNPLKDFMNTLRNTTMFLFTYVYLYYSRYISCCNPIYDLMLHYINDSIWLIGVHPWLGKIKHTSHYTSRKPIHQYITCVHFTVCYSITIHI